ARQKIYQELIDAKVIELTTNREYERFVAKLEQAGVAAAAKSREASTPDAYRQKSVDIMSALNPERVFRIRIPAAKVVAGWHAQLASMTVDALSAKANQLDVANAILPGRVNMYELIPEVASGVVRAAEVARTEKPDSAAFREAAMAFLARATGGHYTVNGGF